MSAPERPLAVLIMAAGKGTRMNNPEMAKVMFPVGGLPMIHHVVNVALGCGANPVIAIVGHQHQTVTDYLAAHFGSRVQFALQVPQLGTGHAVMQAVPLLQDFDGDVLILSGDVPLIAADTLRGLLQSHRATTPAATVLTVIPPDPAGYGRVVRDENGGVDFIVEHKDATDQQREIREINSGIYVFNCRDLLQSVKHLTDHNAQNEYYLTDVFAWLRSHGRALNPYLCQDYRQVAGINTVEQLAEIDALLK